VDSIPIGEQKAHMLLCPDGRGQEKSDRDYGSNPISNCTTTKISAGSEIPELSDILSGRIWRTEGNMGLESITQAIREEISKLNQVLRLLGGGKTKVKGRRKISAAARRKISAAQKARWKKVRAAKK
jgi:hypothetical protein